MSGCLLYESKPEGVVAARELLGQSRKTADDEWGLDTLAGRFVEVSGSAATAALTITAGLILQAQQRGGLAVWIGGHGSAFFPPDFAASGIDLEALPVVRVDDEVKAWLVADTLVRSGAFAIVILDLGSRAKFPLPVQTRLMGLAKKHHTVLLVITRKGRRDVSGGSLVSLRAETEKKRANHDCFIWKLYAVKDKRRVPGWSHSEICHGPDGLC
jgi:recombination protein RecA